MRKLLLLAAVFFVITLGWFIVWYFMMAPHVKRVEASIAHHYQRFYTGQRRVLEFPVSIRADQVFATGFPFKFQVAVKNTTLSTVEIDETFAVSVPYLTLESIDSTQGSYRVNLPDTVEALYAKNGQPPENYVVSIDTVPKLNLSAADSKIRCGALTGKRCEPVAASAPLISYALGVPKSVTLHMVLGNESRDARFNLAPMEINVPIYREIPPDINTPLHLFVGVLREALVYKTRDEPNQ